MPTTDKTSEPEQFNLKHRVTGAAVLIFFGALVLPWLLGPPSEAKKVSTEEVVSDTSSKPIRSTFEDEVLAQLQEQSGTNSSYEEPEETVYISKITPFNGRSIASDPEPISDTNEISKVEESSAPPEQSTQNSELQDLSVKKESESAESLSAKAPDPSKNKATPQEINSPRKDSENQTATKTKSIETKQIDVGWIVQVELLTDKKGAERLVKKLESNGFKPKTTIVDTNKGKATGTRIWVGPFENRSAANSKNQQLESKMGKRGFIRVYP